MSFPMLHLFFVLCVLSAQLVNLTHLRVCLGHQSVRNAPHMHLPLQMLPNVFVTQVCSYMFLCKNSQRMDYFFTLVREGTMLRYMVNVQIWYFYFTGFYLDSASQTCLSCPEGAACQTNVRRTDLTLYSMEGFWRDVTALKPSFYICPLSANACPSSANGTCNTGYDGVLCGLCKLGFHLSSNSCTGKRVVIEEIKFFLCFRRLLLIFGRCLCVAICLLQLVQCHCSRCCLLCRLLL